MRTQHFKIKSAKQCKGISIPIYLPILFSFIMTFASCKKWIEVDPPITEISSKSVYSTNASASAVMTGIYDQMEQDGFLTDGTRSISLQEGLASDELTNYSTDIGYTQFYKNALNASSNYYWLELYNQIYACNAVLTGVATSSGVTPSMKQQLSGEAKFMRAFLYFYAINLYGDVPLTITTDYKQNNQLARTPTPQIYQQIIQDLLDAQSALSDNYLDPLGNPTNEKTRPNKVAAAALLSRVYLYTRNWAKAEALSKVVINNAMYNLPSDLTQVFLANSPEAILQFHPIVPDYNTFLSYDFVLTSAPGTGQFNFALSTALQNAFEQGDKRFSNWIGSYIDPSSGQTYLYPFKYRVYQQAQPVTEYFMLLRLAEQYLIHAEAQAQGAANGISGAIADLNIIRNRAGLPNYTGATSRASILAAILHERQVELFTEWGHRWFDLIRTENINSVMGSPGNACQAKGGKWNPDDVLIPLPVSELQLDPNLKQNPGY